MGIITRDKIIGIFCFVDDLLKICHHHEDCRRQVSDSEIITTAIVSSLYFGGHQDNARQFMKMTGLVPGMLDKSRFNRRLHALAELICKLRWRKNAVTAYRLCREAIYEIETICGNLKPKFDFHLVPSLQHASFKTHTPKLRREYELRKKHGFNLEWLDEADLLKRFGFAAQGAIYSEDGGEVDAYRLTHALLADLRSHGHHIYNNTGINEIAYKKSGISLATVHGNKITAKKLIIACGYESLRYVPKKIAEINTTYALISEPLDKKYFWHKNSLIWETAVPYLYFRVASENRILIGGRDDPYHRPHIPPSVISRKVDELVRCFAKLMPHIPLKPDFSWAGAFASTSDGLPYIGSIPERPNTWFALGFGGNGITFSVIAGKIIRDGILGKKNDNASIFQFNR